MSRLRVNASFGIVGAAERELAKEVVDALRAGLVGVLEIDLLDQRLVAGHGRLVAVGPEAGDRLGEGRAPDLGVHRFQAHAEAVAAAGDALEDRVVVSVIERVKEDRLGGVHIAEGLGVQVVGQLGGPEILEAPVQLAAEVAAVERHRVAHPVHGHEVAVPLGGLFPQTPEIVDREAILDEAQRGRRDRRGFFVGVPALEPDVDHQIALHPGDAQPHLIDFTAGAHSAAIGVAALQRLAARGLYVDLDVEVLVGDATIAPLGLEPVHEQLEPGEGVHAANGLLPGMPDQTPVLEIVEPTA